MESGIIFDNVIKEVESAEKARSAKLPGRARVGYRWAAAQAIVFYCLTHQVSPPTGAILDKINTFRAHPEPAPGIHAILDHLLLQFNSDFQRPGTWWSVCFR